MAALLSQPLWVDAAQALIDGCVDLPSDEDRVALMAAVCQGLGDELYPAFIRVLWTIGQYGDHSARAAVARALVHALRTGRLPSGRRSAWGGGELSSSPLAYGRTRTFGPIEYVCVWYAQTEPARALSASQFDTVARALLDLLSSSRDARLLYCEKLLADVDDPIGGAFARPTREAVRAMACAWAEGASPADASARFICTLAQAVRGGSGPLYPQAAVAAR